MELMHKNGASDRRVSTKWKKTKSGRNDDGIL